MEWYVSAIILFIALLTLLALGLPVGFSLGLTGLGGIFIFIGPQGLRQIAILMVEFGTRPDFLCVPMFVFMAEFISIGGAASDIFSAAQRWLHKMPGGLGVGTVVACGVFGAACGTSTGGAAAMGLVVIPELLKRGYDRRLTLGTVAAGGTLSILIPPSGIMILYAIITEQSIGRLFIAGIVPGIMMVGLFSLYIVIYAKLRPKVAPTLPKVSWRERLAAIRPIWAILIVIISVFGTIYTGICTVTEAAATGAFAALLITALRKGLTWRSFKEAGIRAACVSCFIYFIVIGAMTFGYLLSYLNITQQLSELIVGSGLEPIYVIIMIMVLYLFLGCVIDPAGILVLTIPVFFPVIERLGFDPIWFGILATINMEAGNITPPVGLNLFVIKRVSPPEVSLGDITRGSLPFVFLLALGMAAIIIWPEIALWLPTTMMGR